MTRPLRPPTHELPRVFSREEGNAVEEALLGIVTTINNYLSNYILIILLLGMGIWFTVRTKAIQFRCFGEGMAPRVRQLQPARRQAGAAA